jgi:glycosyltransferase 2 family protein
MTILPGDRPGKEQVAKGKLHPMDHVEKETASGKGRPLGRLTWGFILLILLAGVVLIVLDWQKFAAVLARADWRPLLVALLLTVLAYLSVSAAFAMVGRLLDIRMSFLSLTETGFVSIILNHVLTAGGMAGLSVRFIIMRRRGVEPRDIVAISILHFYLTSLFMIVMLPVAFLYLFLNANLPGSLTILVGAMTLLLTILAVIATLVIFMKRLRTPLIHWLIRQGRRLLHRDVGETLRRFDVTMSRAVKAMRRQPITVIRINALNWVDWLASVAVLWLCFDALGDPVSLGVVLTGYVIGVMAGVLSMVPGGLGVQEGSMTGIFVLLGGSFQQSLLASILFRGVFFMLPYGVSLLFYRRLLRQGISKQ